MIPLESWVSQAMSSSLLLGIPVAMLAGVISFASPCVLPLLPGYLSFASGLGAHEITQGPTPVLKKMRADVVRPTHAGRSSGT